jgi:hypothetical protein
VRKRKSQDKKFYNISYQSLLDALNSILIFEAETAPIWEREWGASSSDYLDTFCKSLAASHHSDSSLTLTFETDD